MDRMIGSTFIWLDITADILLLNMHIVRRNFKCLHNLYGCCQERTMMSALLRCNSNDVITRSC